MKRHILFSFAIFTCLATAVASASPQENEAAGHRVVPVLVRVDKQGKVTNVNPAYKLRPAFVRSIRESLDKMITKPALKKGKPVASQFVVNLELLTVPKGHGAYAVTFKYLSTKALPTGDWYWVHTPNDGKLALADQRSSNFIPATIKSPVEAKVDAWNNRAQHGDSSH